MTMLPLGPPDGHGVLVHRGGTDRALALTRWASRGIHAREQVLLEDVDDAHMAVLASTIPSLERHLASGQLRFMGADTVFLAEWLSGCVDQALRDGYRGVRVAAAHRDAPVAASDEELADREAAVESLSATRPISALCAVDLDRMALDSVARVLRHHRRIAGAEFHIVKGAASLRVVGVLDRFAEATTRIVMDQAVEDAVGVLSIDLTEVSIMGAAGVRVLTHTTHTMRQAGDRVLVHASPAARRVLDTVRLWSLPGFSLEESGTPDAEAPDGDGRTDLS